MSYDYKMLKIPSPSMFVSQHSGSDNFLSNSYFYSLASQSETANIFLNYAVENLKKKQTNPMASVLPYTFPLRLRSKTDGDWGRWQVRHYCLPF